MSPEFRYSNGDADEAAQSSDEERRAAADYSRFRFTNTGRRKLRGKKTAAPSGLHKRHNKRMSW